MKLTDRVNMWVNTIIVAHIIKKNVVSHLTNQFFGVDLEQAAWTNCLQTQNCNETSGQTPAAEARPLSVCH
jgi:hypothetical protein